MANLSGFPTLETYNNGITLETYNNGISSIGHTLLLVLPTTLVPPLASRWEVDRRNQLLDNGTCSIETQQEISVNVYSYKSTVDEQNLYLNDDAPTYQKLGMVT